MKQRFRIGKISFQDPLILCGALAILLYFDASGFLRVGLLAAVLHEMAHDGLSFSAPSVSTH